MKLSKRALLLPGVACCNGSTYKSRVCLAYSDPTRERAACRTDECGLSPTSSFMASREGFWQGRGLIALSVLSSDRLIECFDALREFALKTMRFRKVERFFRHY